MATGMRHYARVREALCNQTDRRDHSPTMPDPDEAALIARVIAGDESAFRSIFRRHSPTMYAVALRMLAHNAADAEDAVQEAWLRAVRGLPTFRGESAVGTWLVGIAVRCAFEACRRRRPPDVESSAVATPPRGRVDSLDLERTIASLADGYRHVLVLHDVYGYTHAEIGALLEIDEGTSKSQLSRARHVIRQALDPTPLSQEPAK
jgi:RNA polymerase sigma-70 factor, ECF subfamily